MANLKVKEVSNLVNIEVGDLIITNNIERLIIQGEGKFHAICPKNMIICCSFNTLRDVAECYCTNPHRIIKAKNLTLMEE